METITTRQLVEAGALPSPVLAACLLCIQERCNLLVAGPTGTGKTTLLQALCRHIPASDSVLVIDAGGGVRAAEAGWRRVEWRGGQTRESFRDAVRLVAAGIHLVVHLDRDHSGTRGVKRTARLTQSGDGWKTRLLGQESAFDNGLRAGELERLAFLSEECAEAIQAVTKILRHGWESRDPTNASSPTNRQMLETELGDLRFAVAALTQAGDVSAERIAGAAIGRAADPGRYMHHQGQGRDRSAPSAGE